MALSTPAFPIINADRFSSLINHVQTSLNQLSAQFFEAQGDGSPDECNREVIQSAEVALMDSLSVLSGGLADLSAASESLVSLQAQVQHTLARTRALTSPLRWLPVELLQLIFQYVHQVECPYRGVYSSPPAVSQVSRLWRRIALDTPCLWKGIKLHVKLQKSSNQLERLSLCIKRSANCPVTLIVRNTTVSRSSVNRKATNRTWTKAGTTLARTLEPYGRRIGALHLEIESNSAMLALLGAWHQSKSFAMPSLKLLEFGAGDCPKATDWVPLMNFFRQKATGLETLVLACSSPGANFTVPSPRLKVFRGRLDDAALPNLFTCQDLEILEIRYFRSWAYTQGRPFSPLTRLTSLHLITSDFRGATTYLPLLPALQHLIISQGNDNEGGLRFHLFSMLEAWGAKLKYLSILVNIRVAPTSIQYLQTCLSLAPELEALRLCSCNDSRHIEVMKTAKLPLLTHCEFHFDSLAGEVKLGLEDFARNAKKEYLRGLSTLHITYSDKNIQLEDQKTFMAHVAELSKAGVVTTFKKRSTNIENLQFDGPYFERIGGLFTSDLYLLS